MPPAAPVEVEVRRQQAVATGTRLRLVLLSFLMLFVELGLIRYSSAYIVYLLYFTNFVLLASFLGIGVGFLRSRSRRDLSGYAPLALLVLLLFLTLSPVEGRMVQNHAALRGLFGGRALPIWFVLPVIFALSFVSMALVGEGVARTFRRFAPLEAYRLDILGSIAGIGAFSLLSFLDLPPLAWALTVGAVFVVVDRRFRRPLAILSLAGMSAILAVLSFVPGTHWSPYYRVTVRERPGEGTAVRVNGLPHQIMSPLSVIRRSRQFYLLPYERAAGVDLRNVLIVGAGTGNDVAVALAEGARHVDAVEIDPVLYQLGLDHHPNHPYQDPRVRAHINDGRAFLHDTDRRYDLILFALPDSLTLVSGQSSLRLESYLFTLQAMEEVRDHLSARGAFAMYNFYRPFVFDRYGETLTEVFGHRPCADLIGRKGSRLRGELTASMDPSVLRCDTRWTPSETPPSPASDDHPFPYLPNRSIPPLYLWSLGLILIGAAAAVRAVSGPLRQMSRFVDLFFMGAAFLLLETKNVVQFALLFGTTWFVNALVFAGILVSVFAAIEVARRTRMARPVRLYWPLLGSIAVAMAVPPDSLLGLGFLPRFLAATALAFTPVFFANLVFAERFRDVDTSTMAFGANLLGAMLGGVLEYSALVIGYRALLLLVAGLYLAALMAGRRHLRDSTPARTLARAG